MTAVILTVTLFVGWTAVGAAILRLLPRPAWSPHCLLLAPATGLSVSLLGVFWLNAGVGLPVASFAWAFAVGLALLVALPVGLRRPAMRWRPYVGAFPVLGVALALGAWPMARYGFDWLSFCNDDMASYVLAAERFARHGFFEVPDEARFVTNTDATLASWFMYAMDGSRSGVELILAFVIGLTGRSGHQVYMPVIESFYLSLLCAAGAMAARHGVRGRRGLMAMALLACSALTTFGVLYQLIAQVLGLTLLCAFSALVGPVAPRRGDAILAVVIGAALLVGYPEVTPFLVLALMGQVAWCGWRRRRLPLGLAARWSGLAVAAMLLIAPFAPGTGDYLLMQVDHGTSHRSENALFPYYLVPSGLANAAGLLPIGATPADPELSLCIVLGAVTCLAVGAATLRQALRGRFSGFVLMVMLGVGVLLFARQAGFGLYKLAMFVQPFAVACIAAQRFDRRALGRLAAVCLAVLCLFNLNVAARYVDKSCGVPRGTGGGFVEVPHASADHMIEALLRAGATIDAPVVLTDTSNIVINKIQCLYFFGRTFYSPTFGMNLTYFGDNSVLRQMPRWRFPRLAFVVDAAKHLHAAMSAQVKKLLFDTHTSAGEVTADPFSRLVMPCEAADETRSVLLEDGHDYTIFNRLHKLREGRQSFIARPLAQVRNHLVFMPSLLGQENYYGKRDAVTLYQMEPDPMLPDACFAGLGRWLLFEVLRPEPRVRMAVEISRTLMHDGECRLPPASVVGMQRASLPLIGRGSARVFSPPVVPQQMAGLSFIMLDLGMKGQPFVQERSGLMRLFGLDVSLDARRLVAFGRDVSLCGEAEYEALTPPPALELPRGLRDRGLEYSGLYEDGWVGDEAWCRLSAGDGVTSIRVRGMVPLIDDAGFQSVLSVTLDGKAVGQFPLAIGDFDVTAKFPAVRGKHTIGLSFGRTQSLPAPDGRPAAALLRSVELVP